MMHRPVTICWSRSRGSGFASCADTPGGPTREPMPPDQLHPQPSAIPTTSAVIESERPPGGCPSNCPALASENVPLRAPASPAQFSDSSPRTAGPQPRDVLRLALRRGEASEGGRSPPPSYLDGDGGSRRLHHVLVVGIAPQLPDEGIHDEVVDVDDGDHQQGGPPDVVAGQ